MKFLLSILAVLALITASAGAVDKEAAFPKAGTPYVEARLVLLKQGLVLAPDIPGQPNAQFRECDEDSGQWFGKPVCKAYFLETGARGWKYYVIVVVYLDTMTVADVHYPTTPEGHIAIPGPFPKGVPAIRDLPYLRARKVLRASGFRPARNHNSGWPGRVCADLQCRHDINLPEAGCSGTGAAFCTTYWISPGNRVLKVTTAWEYPQIYFAEWSSWENLKDDFSKLPD